MLTVLWEMLVRQAAHVCMLPGDGVEILFYLPHHIPTSTLNSVMLEWCMYLRHCEDSKDFRFKPNIVSYRPIHIVS